jgi:hypothetical protein
MLKRRFAILALLFWFSTAGFSTAALAQTLTAEQRSACQADYNKYCKGTVPGGGRIIACLDAQRDRLSGACRKVLDAQKK